MNHCFSEVRASDNALESSVTTPDLIEINPIGNQIFL